MSMSRRIDEGIGSCILHFHTIEHHTMHAKVMDCCVDCMQACWARNDYDNTVNYMACVMYMIIKDTKRSHIIQYRRES